jgi:hypothetical protein
MYDNSCNEASGGCREGLQIFYGVANDGGANPDGLPRTPLIRLRIYRNSSGICALASSSTPEDRSTNWLRHCKVDRA